MTEKPIQCTVKNPIALSIGENKQDFCSGCKTIDITFPNFVTPEVGEFRFKNYYTANISIKVKLRHSEANADSSEVRWVTCLKRYKLMTKPHYEQGAQDYFKITRKQLSCDLLNVSGIRIILRQPSPIWKDFYLEDVKLFRTVETSRIAPLPVWLTDEEQESRKGEKKPLKSETTDIQSEEKLDFEGGVPNMEKMSTELQQLWAMTEEAAAQQTDLALGRYDVDGCYEINLLSYT